MIVTAVELRRSVAHKVPPIAGWILFLSACSLRASQGDNQEVSGDESAPSATVSYIARIDSSRTSGDLIAVAVDAHNSTRSAVELVGDGCRVLLRARSVASPRVVWREEHSVPPGALFGCPQNRFSVRLLPGANAAIVTTTISPRRVLGDSLPGGRYEILARIALSGDTTEVAVGNVVLLP